MGNLAREEAFSPADLRTMLIDRQCIESVDMYLQTESAPPFIEAAKSPINKRPADSCRLFPSHTEFRGTFDPRVLSISGA